MVLSTGLLVAPSAHASYNTDKLKAADAVESKLKQQHSRWKWLASCKSTSSATFSCSISGFKGHSVANGRAHVRKVGKSSFRVAIVSLKFS